MGNIRAITKDANNYIESVWFTLRDKDIPVTTMPVGQKYDVHVSVRATKQYIADRDGRGVDWLPEWGINVVGMDANATRRQGKWAHTVLPIFESTVYRPDMVLNNVIETFSDFVMPQGDVELVVLLFGNRDQFQVFQGPGLSVLRQFVGSI